MTWRAVIYFSVLGVLFVLVGIFQSWSVALATLNLCLISAIMALGVNIQWGFGGLFNAGIMGFAAIGGITALIISHPPVYGAIQAGGIGIATSGVFLLIAGIGLWLCLRLVRGPVGIAFAVGLGIVGFVFVSSEFSEATRAIEAVDPASTGFLGGFGLPIVLSWVIAGFTAAAVAIAIGKIALGLRADYLAIATLGIAEIIAYITKNEEWLTRGVKNVTGLPSPVPAPNEMQSQPWVQGLAEWLNAERLQLLSEPDRAAALGVHVAETASILIKLSYAGLFTIVLAAIATLCALALNSPWGRMVRAIRDNEIAAEAMGKDVRGRHMQLLALGCAVVGIAGAMLVTYEGQLTPISYQPLRYTFLIWVMVIVGGSGSNAGAIFGAFIVWFIWIQSETIGYWLVDTGTYWMSEDSPIRAHFLKQAQYFRLFIMGVILLVILRFNPGGLIPEQLRQKLQNQNGKHGGQSA